MHAGQAGGREADMVPAKQAVLVVCALRQQMQEGRARS
jgi:hypothetical protein